MLAQLRAGCLQQPHQEGEEAHIPASIQAVRWYFARRKASRYHAWAVIIHKVQELSLDMAVMDLGKDGMAQSVKLYDGALQHVHAVVHAIASA